MDREGWEDCVTCLKPGVWWLNWLGGEAGCGRGGGGTLAWVQARQILVEA